MCIFAWGGLDNTHMTLRAVVKAPPCFVLINQAINVLDSCDAQAVKLGDLIMPLDLNSMLLSINKPGRAITQTGIPTY